MKGIPCYASKAASAEQENDELSDDGHNEVFRKPTPDNTESI
jgi:hypothetical protein